MLVLSRKKGESIILGYEGEIEIAVVEIQGERVRIGVNAPRKMNVARREIYKHDRGAGEGTEAGPV